MNCFAIPNRRLLAKKVGWDWSGVWQIVASLQGFSSGASEQSERAHSLSNAQCLTWSQLLNAVRTFFERNPE
jgi:hypothetical protein